MGLGKYIWTDKILDLEAVSVWGHSVRVTDTGTDNAVLKGLGEREAYC